MHRVRILGINSNPYLTASGSQDPIAVGTPKKEH
jgi:hypothetical protein